MAKETQKPAEKAPEQKALSFKEVFEQSENLRNQGYAVRDISSELVREIVTEKGVYSIPYPVALITRPGGSTHRVVDAGGTSHCYAAPETGKSVLRWKNRKGVSPVSF